ncbi:MAG: exodeoxyribonuclease VII small subunit [Chloroflexi bacterium]|nr:exodeoxyribonuclease VII small subunit [Chloroflexota bacterium]
MNSPTERISPEQLDYEAALGELESITAALESGDHSLEESLALYERGQALAQRCAGLLEQAELRLQTLTDDFPSPEV